MRSNSPACETRGADDGVVVGGGARVSEVGEFLRPDAEHLAGKTIEALVEIITVVVSCSHGPIGPAISTSAGRGLCQGVEAQCLQRANHLALATARCPPVKESLADGVIRATGEQPEHAGRGPERSGHLVAGGTVFRAVGPHGAEPPGAEWIQNGFGYRYL